MPATSFVRFSGGVITAAMVVLIGASPAVAHQKWFVDNPDAYPVAILSLVHPWVLVGVVAAVGVTLLVRLVAARLPVPELAFFPLTRRLSGLVPWVPRLLAAHLGLSLVVLATDGAVLDPSIRVPDGAEGMLLLVPQAVVGVVLIAGVLVRPAAVAVMFAGPVIAFLEGLEPLGTLAVLLGSAVFLAILPPRLENGGRVNVELVVLRRATVGLKLGAGVTLVWLSVVEKLANPAMARAMVEQVPILNIFAPLGMSAEGFVLLAGSVELLFGLLIISGALPQVVALAAAVPFTATVALFGATELVGHLPVYGVLLTLLILGSREDTSRIVSGFRLSALIQKRHHRPIKNRKGQRQDEPGRA